MTHTPTPWSLCNNGNCSCLTISCADHPIAKVESGEWGDEYPSIRPISPSVEGKFETYMERIGYGTIDPETAKANALLIVEAVNAWHDVDALQARIAFLSQAHETAAESPSVIQERD